MRYHQRGDGFGFFPEAKSACAHCQREFAALRWTRELVASRPATSEVPADAMAP